MYPYCYTLQNSLQPLKDMAVLSSFDPNKNYKYQLPLHHASVELLSYQRDDFLLSSIEVFVIKKYSRLGCHIDADSPDGSIKLNFRYGDPKSHMEWFMVKVPHAPSMEEIGDSLDNKNYTEPTIVFNEEKMKLVHSAQINTPSIVNVSLPHGLNNEESSEPLITVACIFDDSKGKKMSLDQAISYWGNL